LTPERLVLCGGAAAPAESSKAPQFAAKPLALNLQGSGANVFLKITDISEAMIRNVPDALMDLVEIAVYVFAADQAAARGGADDDGSAWRRRFRFHIPIRCPELWSRREVTEALVDILSFLSDDDYAFTFSTLDHPPPLQLYFESVQNDFNAEEVVLFSGGLDSLAGAIQESLVDHRQVALISHTSGTKRTPQIAALARDIVQRAGPGRVRHVSVSTSKSGNVGREYTQRTRSFMYATLATTVASMLGHDRIRFFENGVTSLNLPIAPQLVGGRASRTTHPRSLHGLARLFSELLGRPFGVENPFIWKTKTDIVRLIKEQGCGALIARSVSCSRTMEATRLHTHCGRCSQCIDRRFATLAAELTDQEDPAEMYKVDLLTGERTFGENRTMAESFLRRAGQLRSIPEMDFFVEYPEATRVLRHVGLASDEAGRRIWELHRRHGEDVFAALAEGHRRHAREFQEGKLPDSCILVLSVPQRYRQAADDSASPTPCFRLEGEFWKISFENERTSLKDHVGLRSIARLLATPGRPWHSADLVAQHVGDPDRKRSVSAGKISDGEAIRQYKKRWHDIEAELRQATAAGDPHGQLELREEAEEIERHLKRITTVRGNPRSATNEDQKARQAVSAAIRRALRTISSKHPPLWRHLYKYLKTGLFCCYEPDPPIDWITE